MAKRQKKQRRDRTPDEVTTRPSMHERLAVTRVRAEEELIKLHGEEWAEARRREDLERLEDELSGARQRAAGHKSPGRRGKYKVPPEVLCNAVEDLHKQHDHLTWNDVCSRVARSHGYKSPESVRKVARKLKWPDPRRARRNTK